MTMNSLPSDILSKVFHFADPKDLASITLVSQEWKNSLEEAEQTIWRSLMEKKDVRLAKIIAMGPNVDNEYSWKAGFKILVGASAFEPVGVNKQLQKDLETVFSPRGIVAFSNCCHFRCSAAYNEFGDDNFQEPRRRHLFCAFCAQWDELRAR